MGSQMQPVFSVATLAERWGCGADTIYSLVKSGDLESFKLGGKLIRIRADAVEKFECQANTAYNASEESSPSSGTKTDDATDIRLERLIARQPMQRPGVSGAAGK